LRIEGLTYNVQGHQGTKKYLGTWEALGSKLFYIIYILKPRLCGSMIGKTLKDIGKAQFGF